MYWVFYKSILEWSHKDLKNTTCIIFMEESEIFIEHVQLETDLLLTHCG